MFARAWLLVVLPALCTAPVLAQSAPPSDGEGRYVLQEVRAGYLRLDRESGVVSLCRERGEAWTCELIAEDRGAYEAEIEALETEKAALEARVAALETRLAEIAGLADAPVEAGAAARTDLAEGAGRAAEAERFAAEDEELDRALDFTEDAMRRLFGVLREFQRDMEPDGGSAR
ncbi:hypothetical protein [Amorphus coralli]|uniref:hypothetical protein n=1 Tax=Amorphus coralli TaxID=340680 RepID=UPI000378E494|nr:hypothetical protein [Amorphus coralli]